MFRMNCWLMVRCVGPTVACLLAACGTPGEDNLASDRPAAPEPASMLGEVVDAGVRGHLHSRRSEAAPGIRSIGRFEGEIDPYGAGSTVRFIPGDPKSAALPGVGRSPRTGAQLALEQDLDVLGYTTEACGAEYWDARFAEEGPEWRFWVSAGAQRTAFYQRLLNGPPDSDGEDALRFCTDFTLRNVSTNTYGDLWLMFDGIALERGYAFVDSVPRRLEGLGPDGTDLEFAPVSDRGMFNYGPLAPSEEVTRQWYFYRAPGSALQRFRVSGEVVEILHEQCGTGQDNNGDGIVDSGCGSVPEGGSCYLDADCQLGTCHGAVLDPDATDQWVPGTCDAGLGAACNEDADCPDGTWCPTDTTERFCSPDLLVAGLVPMRFQYVPSAGQSFLIGSPEGEEGRVGSREAQTEVWLTRDLFVQRTPVWQAQWQQAILAWNARPDGDRALSGFDGDTPPFAATPGFFQPSIPCVSGSCPIERVNWWEAVVFANLLSRLEGLDECYVLSNCTKGTGSDPDRMGAGCAPMVGSCSSDTFVCDSVELPDLHCNGYRLPTEAEWEFATRAGTTTATYGGDLDTGTSCAELSGAGDYLPGTPLGDIAWYTCNSGSRVLPAETRGGNAWGLFDTLGNVWEHTFNRFEGAQAGGDDPVGPGSGIFRTARGGGWDSMSNGVRSAVRVNESPHVRSATFGFRLVRAAPAPAGTTCSSLTPPADGSVLLTGNAVGDTANYSCFPGTTLFGPAQRTCAANGEWTQDKPVCVAESVDLGDPCVLQSQCPGESWCPTHTSEARCAPHLDLGNGVDMPFLFAPSEGQTFSIGSPMGELGRNSDETLVSVTLTRNLFVQRTPVTQGQWREVIQTWNDLDDAVRTLSGWTGPTPAFGTNPSHHNLAGNCTDDDCPVDRVNWWDAVVFANILSRLGGLPECYAFVNCQDAPGAVRVGGGCDDPGACNVFTCQSATFSGPGCLGYRLPTEAEWEFAARAGTTTATHLGDLTGTALDVQDCTNPIAQPSVDPIAWYCASAPPADRHPKPVGSLAPNPWGLFDTLGNVWEHTWNWHNGFNQTGGTDPLGPGSTSYRSARGGAYYRAAAEVRSAVRARAWDSSRNIATGFRLVRTVAP